MCDRLPAVLIFFLQFSLPSVSSFIVLYAKGMGITSMGSYFILGGSTILALAMERANPQRRGRALASFSVAFPLSYGLGAFMTGSGIDLVGYGWTYFALAVFMRVASIIEGMLARENSGGYG